MDMINTFLGLRCSQDWNDFPIWEAFFRNFEVRTFIELGTDNGGMSLYFLLQCLHRGIEFHTFDHQKWVNFDTGVPHLLNLHSTFHMIDLFSEAGTAEVAKLLHDSPKPVGIFFDNGNKPREWKIFAPMLSPGDFCIVHDWGTEFLPSDIGEVKVERILEQMSDLRVGGWQAMWFRRL